MTENRLTLICKGPHTPQRDWDLAGRSDSRVVVTEDVATLAYATRSAGELALDVQRIIFDRSISGDRFLQLLTELPDDFTGDVLYIRADGHGYLSASTRITGRAMYSLEPADVRFYLEAAGVVTDAIAIPRGQATAAA